MPLQRSAEQGLVVDRGPERVTDTGTDRSAQLFSQASRPVGAGSIFVVQDGQRVWLTTRDALRLRVLEQLAKHGRFRLEVGELEPILLSLRLDGVPLADALSAVLRDTSYSIDYAFDDALDAHVARIVRVGGFRAFLEKPSSEDEWRHEVSDEAGSSAESAAGSTAGRRPGTDAQYEDLSSATDALDDAAIQVILDSIGVLEDPNDPSVLSSLRPLLSHPNAAVRERADEAIEWLD